MSGWIGVDLDGTLAVYDGWVSEEHIGEPVEAMVNRVLVWRMNGIDVRIFTARVAHSETALAFIEAWCQKHLGEVLPVTNQKDYGMVQLWDDRCVAVEPNTGKILGGTL